MVQEPDEEDAEAVDDEVTGPQAVDVGGDQVSLAHPLGILHVDVCLAVVSPCSKPTEQNKVTLFYFIYPAARQQNKTR